MAKLSITDFQKTAKERGGECLTKKYTGIFQKMIWECSEGHRWQAVANSVKNSGKWCPECGGSKPLTIKDARRIAKKKGGKFLSKKYINTKTKYKWQCSEGHIWEATLESVKRTSWCPICSRSLGEETTRQIFEKLLGKKLNKARPRWLRNERGNQMELDGYNENLKLAFEFHGNQHYSEHKLYYNKGEFQQRVEDDKYKKQLCKKEDILLIEVPYKEFNQKLSEYVEKKLLSSGYKLKKNSQEIEIDYPDLYKRLEKRRKELVLIAQKRGGELISKKYINSSTKMTFKCAKGHLWNTIPESIIQGKWCPKCGKTQKLTIEEIKRNAKKRGGKCLSNKYINAHSKLKWMCSRGHTWKMSAHAVRRGRWCPECGGTKKLTLRHVQDVANFRGGLLLSKKYEDSATKYTWQCSEGHIWEATLNSVKRASWCPHCSNRAKKTLENMQELAKNRMGKCLSKKYVNAHTKLEWECENKHRWFATPHNILRGRWCPQCARLKRKKK